MFPHGSVAMDILGREKIEACIFLTSYGKRMPTSFIFFACSQLHELQVLLDINSVYHGYLLPCMNTNNKVFT